MHSIAPLLASPHWLATLARCRPFMLSPEPALPLPPRTWPPVFGPLPYLPSTGQYSLFSSSQVPRTCFSDRYWGGGVAQRQPATAGAAAQRRAHLHSLPSTFLLRPITTHSTNLLLPKPENQNPSAASCMRSPQPDLPPSQRRPDCHWRCSDPTCPAHVCALPNAPPPLILCQRSLVHFLSAVILFSAHVQPTLFTWPPAAVPAPPAFCESPRPSFRYCTTYPPPFTPHTHPS